MNCPNCGTPEKVRVRVCGNCGNSYASIDLLEYRNLEYLLAESAKWNVAEKLRKPYAKKLKRLKERILPRVEAISEELEELAQVPESQISQGTPKEKKVSFDQWLLSERNIKISLYSGAALLLMAGFIFIGINWTRIPGLGKLSITLLITGLTYFGGYWLYQRPTLKLGGNALLAIALGFLALDFSVMQIYVLGSLGIPPDVLWLIASPLCLLAYGYTAKWTQNGLFTTFSILAIISTSLAGLAVVNANLDWNILGISLLFLSFLWVSRFFEGTKHKEYTSNVILLASQIGIPFLFLLAYGNSIISLTCRLCDQGYAWVSIGAMFVAVVYYIALDMLSHKRYSRWLSTSLFALSFGSALYQGNVGDTTLVVSHMGLALAYLVIANRLRKKNNKMGEATPLIVVAYGVAFFVTFATYATASSLDLVFVLLGDVAILAISAYIFGDFRWVQAAIWVFVLPTYIYPTIITSLRSTHGLWLGSLGIAYTVAGYVLGRRKMKFAWPFMRAAATLSLITAFLTWQTHSISIPILGIIASLYVFVALWTVEANLLVPGLSFLSALVFQLNQFNVSVGYRASPDPYLISFSALGLLMGISAMFLRKSQTSSWRRRLYLMGGVNYIGALFLALRDVGGWLAFDLLILFSAFVFLASWHERKHTEFRTFVSRLPYLGIGTLFVALFYLLILILPTGNSLEWSPYFALLAFSFVLIAWFTRNTSAAEVFELPFRYMGLRLMILPMLTALFSLDSLIVVFTYSISGATYIFNSVIKRRIDFTYFGVLNLVIVAWALLVNNHISEPQVFVFPISFALLGMGWVERAHREDKYYRVFSAFGLGILMGSAFIQSIPRGESTYAMLLAVESLIAIVYGVRTKSRVYVQIGGLSFIGIAGWQFGPALSELPRWVQIGLTGAILLGIGMTTLLKRDLVIRSRTKISENWRKWDS